MIIRGLHIEDEAHVQAAALVLRAAFAHGPYCDTLAEAAEEVNDALQPGGICLAAHDDTGEMWGWIGGRHSYGLVWELHPLAVHPKYQRRGIGRSLVVAFEKRVVAAGGLTITLGTDDELGGTNLYGRDLYPEVLGFAQRLESVAGHPFVFYQKAGFVVTGLVPDANGLGKHDILMCKRVGRGP